MITSMVRDTMQYESNVVSFIIGWSLFIHIIFSNENFFLLSWELARPGWLVAILSVNCAEDNIGMIIEAKAASRLGPKHCVKRVD